MATSTSNSQILSIYKSRTTILELLEKQEYQISGYDNFNLNEIDAMYKNSQLDMLVNRTNKNTNEIENIYVKYYLEKKQLRLNILNDIIEDLFTGDSTTTLTKKDTLIIIVDNEPNETIISNIEYKYENEGIFVILFNIKRLQFNILNHSLVPPIKILSKDESEVFMQEYNIQNLSELPEISRFDPQAQAIFMRPQQICEIERSSVTALLYKYYRVCV
jgi:DNA-directed RNA polymerase subunit H (RpoH/RPB5)